jgi:hypothetical protein
MMLLKLLIAILVPMVPGYFSIRLIMGKESGLSWMETLPLSALLGFGILTLEMLILSAVGIELSVFNLIAGLLLITAYPAFVSIKEGYTKPSSPFVLEKLDWKEVLLIAAILLRVFYVMYETLIKPVLSCDAFANWSLRAKVFYYASCIPVDTQNGYQFGGGQPHYPLHIPLLQTWMFQIIGTWNDQLSKVVFPLLYIFLLMVFYAFAKRFAGRTIALLGTYLLTSLPLLTYHATVEYADLPLAIYFSCAAILLMEYLTGGNKRFIIIAGMLAGISSWTKSEGFFMMLILLLVLIWHEYFMKKADSNSAKNISMFFLAGLIFKIPWTIYNIVFKVPNENLQVIEYWKMGENLSRLPFISKIFYEKWFFYGNWNIAWAVLLVSAACAWRSLPKPRLAYSGTIVIVSYVAIAALYYTTTPALYSWLPGGATVNRNFLLAMPLVIYFITACAHEVFSAKEEVKVKNEHPKRK